jgi:hypothetical protein
MSDTPTAPIEQHQRDTATPEWLHKATVRRMRWGLGREVTRDQYTAAVDETRQHPCGG